MENTLCQYNGEKYSIPYEELGSWNAYIVDLSRVRMDAGHLEIAFHDKFHKYKTDVQTETNTQRDK